MVLESIKIQEAVKKKLDKEKNFDNESYNSVIERLADLKKESVHFEIENPDADWKEKIKKESFFACPKCAHPRLSVYIDKLYSLFDTYIQYGDNETNIISALKNIKSKAVTDPSKFLAEFKKANKTFTDKLKDVRSFGVKDTKTKINYLGVEDCDLGNCFHCNELSPFTSWKTVEKKIKAYTCPTCEFEVLDDQENKELHHGIIMCPKCSYFFDRNWEIFNHIKSEYPTIDHMKYDKKTGVFTIQPYSCDTEFLLNFLLCAKKLDYAVNIFGHAVHNEDCLTIRLERNKK